MEPRLNPRATVNRNN